MAYNSRQKLEANIAALRIVLDWDGKRKLTDQELSSLKAYSGFGGLKAVFYPAAEREEWVKMNASQADLRLYPQVMELHALLKEKLSSYGYKRALDDLQDSSLTAYYTPDLVPRAIYTALGDRNLLPKRLYEPSAGAGIFITEGIRLLPELQNIMAVEKDLLTGKVLSAICSAMPVPAEVQVKGFEETDAKEKGRFDLIASNIPFGNISVFDPAKSTG